MEAYGLNEIREKFLSFFETKEHLRLKSFSLVPQNDKSLLVINSGMAPLKPYFTGLEVPPSKRVTTCQKCIRTNDIENVGITARHGCFFEMLGNFSFGDYFKEEAIPWAWEFMTEVMGIPADKLHVSVYLDDDEAYDIWHNKVGLAEDRINRMGKDSNFWEHGIGPCGPCSEIYYDRGPEYGREGLIESDEAGEDRYIEVWNLVFTQFNKEEDGSYSKLANPNIDTGMGLERLAMVMQCVNSIFDVDTVKAVRDEVCRIAGKTYGTDDKTDISVRIITEHIRSVTFMTADGILPSNEGRGYVLRRLLRRAARHGKLLGINDEFLAHLSGVVIDSSKGAYPELEEKRDYILKLLTVEENRFYETLDMGMEMLGQFINTMKRAHRSNLLGEEAFKLYDTYGFPVELMQEMLSESGLGVDLDAFHEEMERQRQRGRAAREESTYRGAEASVYDKLDPALSTSFIGYENESTDSATIMAIISGDDVVNKVSGNAEISILTDITPIYAESGGQCGDHGTIKTETGMAAITDCIKYGGNKFIQIGKLVYGDIEVGQKCTIIVDGERRASTARNHSATHLLQKALRETLGGHVEQAGSLVTPDRLRFDFTHFAPMTIAELDEVESIVNKHILAGLDINTSVMDIEDARKTGAMALFGEKYGDKVRVVNMQNYSIELCGGTHLKNTARIGSFKILSETGVAAGVRRIEAVTGEGALAYYHSLEQQRRAISGLLKTAPENISSRIEFFIKQVKDLSRELEKLRSKSAGNLIDDIANKRDAAGKFTFVSEIIDGLDMNGLRVMGDKLRDKLDSGVIVIIGKKDDKYNMIVTATDDAVKAGANCGNIIRTAAAIAGGGGGGRPNMAQAGLKDGNKLEAAIEAAKAAVAAI